MATILFIIIIQIIETYQEQHRKTHSSLSTGIPLLTSEINIQPNPILIENITRKIEATTNLARSQTLPLTSSSSVNPHHKLVKVTASSTLKDFNQSTSTRLPLLLGHHQSIKNNYEAFALTTNDQFYPSYTIVTNSDSNPRLSSLIKPIPFKMSCK
jgi:hypothetical protein